MKIPTPVQIVRNRVRVISALEQNVSWSHLGTDLESKSMRLNQVIESHQNPTLDDLRGPEASRICLLRRNLTTPLNRSTGSHFLKNQDI